MTSTDLNMEILHLKEQIVEYFTSSQWMDLALLTDSSELIDNHGRLLRSLFFGDDDYEGNATQVLLDIVKKDPANLQKIHEYVSIQSSKEGTNISSQPTSKHIIFSPIAFNIPDVELRQDLVSVMMPFAGFDSVYTAIKGACSDSKLDCLRADDIWDESTFIQDIVNLIFQSRIVVCDFSRRNPNVFYETGIAHTLGKEVVPIAQSLSDIPSDLLHHRALTYLNNTEGLQKLRTELSTRLSTIINK